MGAVFDSQRHNYFVKNCLGAPPNDGIAAIIPDIPGNYDNINGSILQYNVAVGGITL